MIAYNTLFRVVLLALVVLGAAVAPARAAWVELKQLNTERLWVDRKGTYVHARILAVDWEADKVRFRVRDRTTNRYSEGEMAISNLIDEDAALIRRYGPVLLTELAKVDPAAAGSATQVASDGTAVAMTPAADLSTWMPMTLLKEAPRGTAISLSENLRGSRKISINLVDGVVTLLVNGRSAGQANIADPAYLQAVRDGTLNEFFNVDWIRKDNKGNYDVPIKIESFPLLGQEGNTCWAASFREWAWYLLGERAPHTPALADMRDFMNFISGANTDFYSTESKEDTDKNYDRRAPGRWITLFIGADVREFVVVSNPAWVSDLLLTGHGVIGTGQDIRDSHAFAVLGTDRDKYFVSTWEKEYFGRGRLIPYPVEWVTIISPKRNAAGSVLVPAMPAPRDEKEAKLLAKLEKKMGTPAEAPSTTP